MDVGHAAKYVELKAEDQFRLTPEQLDKQLDNYWARV